MANIWWANIWWVGILWAGVTVNSVTVNVIAGMDVAGAQVSTKELSWNHFPTSGASEVRKASADVALDDLRAWDEPVNCSHDARQLVRGIEPSLPDKRSRIASSQHRSRSQQKYCVYRPLPTSQARDEENTIAVKAIRPKYDGSRAPHSNFGQVQTAMGGYSCVSLIQNRAWVQGSREFASMHRGIRYRFANQQQLNLFVKNPNRFVPVLQGDCLVSWVQGGVMIPGSSQFAAIYRNQIYLFSSQDHKLMFMRSPEKFTNSLSQPTTGRLHKSGQEPLKNQEAGDGVNF